ncbi:MAG: LysE family transporter [Elusimicrobiota bacterium]
MELILIFTGAFIVALSGALMPGPLLTVTIAHSLKKGFIAGPLIIIGHMILEILLLLVIILGFQKYLLMPFVMKSVFFAGAGILFVMGVNLIRSSSHLSLDIEETDTKGLRLHPVIVGIIISFASPYWLVWWLTIGLGYVIKSLTYGLTGLLVFFSGHILADLAWYSFVSFSFSRGKKVLNDSIYRVFTRICGIFLVLIGIWFFYSGFMK